MRRLALLSRLRCAHARGRHFLAALALIVAASASLLTACGGTSDSGSAAAGSDGGVRGEEDYSSPLADFFGLSDTSDQQAAYEERERQRQEWVTTCMANEGFEYQPPNYDQIDVYVDDSTTDGPQPGTREWTEMWGFGISTQAFDQRSVGNGLVGYETSTGRTDAVEWTDPNQEYLDSLSDDEREAYYVALYGDSGYEWDDSLSDEENNAASEAYYAANGPTGCDSKSYDEIGFDDPFQRLYEDFGDELSGMYDRVQADPEVVAAVAEVARCVNDAGFTYVDEETTNDDIYRRLEPVWNEQHWPGDDITEEQWASLSEDEIIAIQNQPAELTAEGKAILAEVQAYEIDLALAVFDCGGTDLYKVYNEVSRRLEQEFVDAHRAELEAYRPD